MYIYVYTIRGKLLNSTALHSLREVTTKESISSLTGYSQDNTQNVKELLVQSKYVVLLVRALIGR